MVESRKQPYLVWKRWRSNNKTFTFEEFVTLQASFWEININYDKDTYVVQHKILV